MRSSFATPLVAGLLLLAGCATQPPMSTPQSPKSAVSQPRFVATRFTIGGRMAVRDTGDNKHGFSGSFNWTHTPTDDVIELITPVGQLAARVTTTRGAATVEMADGRRVTTDDPERTMNESLGISLPLAALPYWMQGAPIPGVRLVVETDALGRLTLLSQRGWMIRYPEYSSDAREAHPTRVEVTQGTIEARILIGEWKPS